MKLPTKAKIESVCADRYDVRQYLRVPYLDTANKCLVATNGQALAVHPVELEPDDVAGFVPLEALKHSRSKLGAHELKLNGTAVTGGASFERPDYGRYPDYQRIMPARPEREPDLIIDAELLADLAKALCEGKQPIVSIWFPETYGGAIRVEPAYVDGPHGCIMPCRKKD